MTDAELNELRLKVSMLEMLLAYAHAVISWTDQDVLKHNAPGTRHLVEARQAYLRHRVEELAKLRPLTSSDSLGCTCGIKALHARKQSPSCIYHYAANLQPWNHRIPWNCPTFYDGCNCPGGYKDGPGE